MQVIGKRTQHFVEKLRLLHMSYDCSHLACVFTKVSSEEFLMLETLFDSSEPARGAKPPRDPHFHALDEFLEHELPLE